MSTAAKSLFAFGIYAVVAGAGLLIAPSLILGTLGFPPAQDGWIRVVGALALFVGIYHIIAARNELLPYIKATVWARIAFALVLAALVLSTKMPAPLLLFAVVDLAGALWTGLALRRVRILASAA
jgi:hypothetical protein